jgi:hypothetical protein
VLTAALSLCAAMLQAEGYVKIATNLTKEKDKHVYVWTRSVKDGTSLLRLTPWPSIV